MIYGISKNHGEGIGCSETPDKKKQSPKESMNLSSSSYMKEEFHNHFLLAGIEAQSLINPKSEALSHNI